MNFHIKIYQLKTRIFPSYGPDRHSLLKRLARDYPYHSYAFRLYGFTSGVCQGGDSQARCREDGLSAPLRGVVSIIGGYRQVGVPITDSALLPQVTVIIPRLLITSPRSEEMVDDHQNFVGDGERSLLLANASLETATFPPPIPRQSSWQTSQ